MTPPRSDHFNGKTFFFPGGAAAPRGFLEVLRWKLTSRATRWPARVAVAQRPPPPAPEGDAVAVTWIGHATFLIRTAGLALLTDPVFSERASPVPWAGPRRATVPGVAFGDLPPIGAVLLSHDHYDHCDLPTLRRLAAAGDPAVLAPLGHRDLLTAAGFRRIVELDWWESGALGPACEATLVPALHWCRRAVGGTNRRLWGGFSIRAGDRHVYFAGDSGYHPTLFARIRERCGSPDLALLPIGAYEPRWFMQAAHMNPAEAVRTHLDIGARASVAMHWGTFQLTDEGREEPVHALEAARAAAGLAADSFRALSPGESVFLPAP